MYYSLQTLANDKARGTVLVRRHYESSSRVLSEYDQYKEANPHDPYVEIVVHNENLPAEPGIFWCASPDYPTFADYIKKYKS